MEVVSTDIARDGGVPASRVPKVDVEKLKSADLSSEIDPARKEVNDAL